MGALQENNGITGTDDAPSKPVRVFVRLFLIIFVIAGLRGVEANPLSTGEPHLWPFTGWKLFSHLRADEQASWEVTTVDSSGKETAIVFSRLPAAYHGAPHILNQFPSLDSREQIRVCRAWASAVRPLGREVASVRIYRTRWRLSDRPEPAALPPKARALAYQCADNKVQKLAGTGRATVQASK